VVGLTVGASGVLDLPSEVRVPAGRTEVEVTARALTTARGVLIVATLPEALGGMAAGASLDVLPAVQDFVPRAIVPGLAWTSGNEGSFFRSSLWITNPCSEPTLVQLRFVPALDQPGISGSGTALLSLAALESRVFRDVLQEAFGVADETFGNVIVEVPDLMPVPVVSGRTFNDSVNGTYGQYIEY
jgi:hypothetical protein